MLSCMLKNSVAARPETLHPAVQAAVAITEAYRQHRQSHPAVREMACLRAQFPAYLSDIEPGDILAGGHVRQRIIYVGTMWWTTMPCKCGPGKQGGYCFDFGAVEKYGQNPADRAVLEELEAFWQEECTWVKIRRTWDADMDRWVKPESPAPGGGSGFVVALEMDHLLRLGLPGLAAEIDKRLEEASRTGETGSLDFLRGLAKTVELVVDICRHYENQAEAQALIAPTAEERARLRTIAANLRAIARRRPETLHEAVQLWWIYSVLTCGLHIEGWRLDEALGDFYAADIDQGRLTVAEAQEVVCGFWRMYAKHSDPAVSRVLIGGRGRRNEAAANRFGMAAMEATRRLRQVIPQLTLRFYAGQDPALLAKAYDVIGEGCIFPTLYNDDVNIPGVAKALQVSLEAAERYYPLGCGEYLIGGASPSLLNVGWSVPKTLEAALFGGQDLAGREMGPVGSADFADFDQLWSAFLAQAAHSAEMGARICAKNLPIMAQECSFLLGSLLTFDCLERGRGLIDGGSRYTGSCIMGHGFSNAADSMAAIRELVFHEKSVTLDELRSALRSNFEGHDTLRRRLQAGPKYGNDRPEVDELLVKLWQELSRLCAEAGERHGIGFLTLSSVNPGGYFMGATCGASADGREAWEPFAIGNAPSAGADTNGLTALLNSIARVDPANGGSVTNIKLAKSLFGANRAKLEALLATYWQRGGMQATLTVVDQRDLEAAMEHPERYPNLLVRMGGWTARFVDLEKRIQREIIRRTLY